LVVFEENLCPLSFTPALGHDPRRREAEAAGNLRAVRSCLMVESLSAHAVGVKVPISQRFDFDEQRRLHTPVAVITYRAPQLVPARP